MNCTATNTSAALTSADEAQRRAALAAGWTDADWYWEHRQEKAAQALHENDRAIAQAHWADALALAQKNFDRTDARLGTAWANAGWLSADDNRRAQCDENAATVWAASALWIDRLQLPGRGRSSLHHLRLQQKNKQVYQNTEKQKLQTLAAAARLRLQQRQGIAAAMWHKHKPMVFDDARKVLGACYLLFPAVATTDSSGQI